MALCARLHFFPHSARTIGHKEQKADVPHAHHRRGWRSPTVRPAPPHHPASCHRVGPPTSAASRTARPPKVQPIAPIGVDQPTTLEAALTRACSSTVSRAHSRRHLLVVDHDRAPAGGQREACRGSAAGCKLRPISLPNDSDAEGQQGRQWADSAHSSRQRSGRHSG